MRKEMENTIPEGEKLQTSEQKEDEGALLVEGLGRDMARWSLSQTSDAGLRLREAIGEATTDMDIAEALSQTIKIDDPNLENLSPKDLDGEKDMVALAIGKAELAEKDVEKKDRPKLNGFKRKLAAKYALGIVTAFLPLVTTACGVTGISGVNPGQLPTESGPRVTQIAQTPTKVPTSVFSKDLLSKPEQEGKKFDGYTVDSQDGSIWRMQADDFATAGNSPGIFNGWVDEESIPEADRQPGIRWGRWSNSEGMGVVRFIKNDTVIDEEGNVWIMIPEDYKMVGEVPGRFDGWIPRDAIPQDERQNGIQWGRWLNSEGQGRVRFEEVKK